MNAPDKIYVPQHNIEAGSIQELCECLVEGSVEYIRKDTLLEWIKKEMKNWSSESNTAQGVKMGLTLVIDKIESL